MARPDASLVSVGRWTPTQSTMRTCGGPDQHDTGRVPSRRPIVTKFSARQQIDPGSRPAEFGERGSIDADVVNCSVVPGELGCPGHSELPTRPLPTMHRTASQTCSVPSRSRIVTKFSVRVQTADGSPRCKFGERGSMDADAVNYAYVRRSRPARHRPGTFPSSDHHEMFCAGADRPWLATCRIW